MKVCSKCGKVLLESNFNKKGSKLKAHCRACDKVYQKKYYQQNRDIFALKQKNRREIQRAQAYSFVRDVKDNSVCVDCKKSFHFVAMDFHHLRDKKFNISEACGWGYLLSRIKEEIEKCEIICANCHRIRTYCSRSLMD